MHRRETRWISKSWDGSRVVNLIEKALLPRRKFAEVTEFKRRGVFQAGFSLVEIAIGLIVIGLIVGGILKGQELIEQARLYKTLTQIGSYHVAYNAFKEKYFALPGDFADAQTLWGQETGNGNQNGIVEGRGMEPHSEAVYFWQHLVLSGLLSYPGALRKSGPPAFGYGLPNCPLGGGFTVEDSPDSLLGLWMILGKQQGTRGNGALLTPEQALFLDRKLDNGDPSTGYVRGREGEGIAPGQCVEAGIYNLKIKEPRCFLYIKLD